MTLFAAVDVSEVVLNGIDNHRLKSQASGRERVWLVKNRCFRRGSPKVTKRHFLTLSLLDTRVGLSKVGSHEPDLQA